MSSTDKQTITEKSLANEAKKISDPRERIARRAALELSDGQYANLGIGIPSLVPNYLPDNVNVTFEAENGVLAVGPTPEYGKADADLANASGAPITILAGGSTFSLEESFVMIRGGHIDTAILGTLEVDQTGSLASWARDLEAGDVSPGMGGAMDLVTGAKRVIVTTTHTTKSGAPKILRKCRLALTGVHAVNLIISEIAVFEVTDSGLLLIELDPNVSLDQLREITEADFSVSADLKDYRMAGVNP